MTAMIAYNPSSHHIEYLESGLIKDEKAPTICNPAYHLAVRLCEKWKSHSVALRAWKAAKLVEAGHVEIEEDPQGWHGATVATVKSQDGSQNYYIGLLHPSEPGSRRHIKHRHSCTCKDYRYNRTPNFYGQPVCKHIIAYQMALHCARHDVKKKYAASFQAEPPKTDPIDQLDRAYQIHHRRGYQRTRRYMHLTGTKEGAAIMRNHTQPQGF